MTVQEALSMAAEDKILTERCVNNSVEHPGQYHALQALAAEIGRFQVEHRLLIGALSALRNIVKLNDAGIHYPSEANQPAWLLEARRVLAEADNEAARRAQ